MSSPTPEDDNDLKRIIKLARICKKHEDKLEETIVKQTKNLIGSCLHIVDFRIHPKELVEELINLFPESLLCKNNAGRFPIQSLVDCNGPRWTIPFIPMMAKIGDEQNVGGVGKRGGLLIVESDGSVLLQNFIQKSIGDPTAVAQLREMNLLMKADVQEFDLLSKHFAILHMVNEATFTFLADLDPDALLPKDSDGQYTLEGMHTDGILLWNKDDNEHFEGKPFIFSTVCHGDSGSYVKRKFETALKAGMRHFPQHLGFLFFKCDKTTPCQLAVKAFGANEAMEIIKRCIPPSVQYPYPILHYAIRRAPKLVGIISQNYPTQLSSRDPETGVYPFIVAASSDCQGDLTCTYSLIRSYPQLVRIHQSTLSSDEDEASRDRDGNPSCEPKRCRKRQKTVNP